MSANSSAALSAVAALRSFNDEDRVLTLEVEGRVDAALLGRLEQATRRLRPDSTFLAPIDRAADRVTLSLRDPGRDGAEALARRLARENGVARVVAERHHPRSGLVSRILLRGPGSR